MSAQKTTWCDLIAANATVLGAATIILISVPVGASATAE
ncbi:hypothetical protein SAMN05421509_1175 [Chromohalobacter canadensis]|uniref:Uncharacterized protein n=1 Tax=Chromohalobacter canadensis TaxID=141389 RepID=A0A285VYF4_9GAMM|nr:hypothetical protein SAMN05421509_1175 [Chromohalobacter canadensis]